MDMANALAKFVKEICESERPYHVELPLILKAAGEMLPYHCADVACVLGSLSGELDLVKMLCIGVSKVLFEGAGMPRDVHVTERARGVIKVWIGGENEWVREMGRSMTTKGVYKDEKWRRALLGEDGNALSISGAA